MGNDIHLIHNGSQICNLGRKHNFLIDGVGSSLPTREEINEELEKAKLDLYKTTLACSIYAQLEDEPEHMIDKLEYAIERYHELSRLAGRIDVVSNLKDEFNEETLEILDDYEIEKECPASVKSEFIKDEKSDNIRLHFC